MLEEHISVVYKVEIINYLIYYFNINYYSNRKIYLLKTLSNTTNKKNWIIPILCVYTTLFAYSEFLVVLTWSISYFLLISV